MLTIEEQCQTLIFPFRRLHMNRFRKLTIVVLACALVLIPGLSSRVSAQDQVTVKVWMHIHPPRVELDKQITAQFEKDNPNIKIDFKWVPDQDWETTLATGLASGAGPDLFNAATFDFGQFKAQDIIA